MNEFDEKRRMLVESMKGNNSLKSKRIEKAFLAVKRKQFFPESDSAYAYSDNAFSIGFGQTISQPSTIAIMLELLQAREGEKVLEVGSGCGYVLALLSSIVGDKGKVIGMELVPELVEKAEENLEKAGVKNAGVIFGDGTQGFPEKAPFKRIIVSAACPSIPKPLQEQLAEEGRIVAPVGGSFTQSMRVLGKRNGKIEVIEEGRGFFRFVPLKGECSV